MANIKNNRNNGGSIFGNLFGKTIGSFLTHMILEDIEKEEKDSWKNDLSEDDIRLGISPWDYDTQSDYYEALAEAAAEDHRNTVKAALTHEELAAAEDYGLNYDSYSIESLKKRISELLSWRDRISYEVRQAAETIGIYAEDYYKEEDYYEEFNSHYGWVEDLTDEEKEEAKLYGIDLYDFEDYWPFRDALTEAEAEREEQEKEENDSVSSFIYYGLRAIVPDEGSQEESALFEMATEYAQYLGMNPEEYSSHSQLYDALALVSGNEFILYYLKKAYQYGVSREELFTLIRAAEHCGICFSAFEKEKDYWQAFEDYLNQRKCLQGIAQNDKYYHRREAATQLLDLKYESCAFWHQEKTWRKRIHAQEIILGFASLDKNDTFLSPSETAEVLKVELFNEFGVKYPSVFGKDLADNTFYDIGSRCAEKKQTCELPLKMLFYLSELLDDTYDTDICSLLSWSGCKAYYCYIAQNVGAICSYISQHKYSERELDHIIRFAKCCVLDEDVDDRISKTIDVFNAILVCNHRKKDYAAILREAKAILENIKRNMLYDVNSEAIDKLAALAEKLDLKAKYPKLYQDAMDKANVILCVLPATEYLGVDKDDFFSTDRKSYDEMIDDLAGYLLWESSSFPFEKMNKYCQATDLSVGQSEARLRLLARIYSHRDSADYDVLEALYVRFQKESALRRLMLVPKENAVLISELSSLAIEREDVAALRVFLNLALLLSSKEAIELFKNHFSEFLLYYASYNTSGNLEERIKKHKKMLALLESNEVTADLKDAIEHYSCAVEEEEQHHQFEIEKAMAIAKDKQIIPEIRKIKKKLQEGQEWINEKKMPKTVIGQFIYPNGKNGDIDMFIAEEYGTVKQKEALLYEVELSSKDKRQIELLAASTCDIPESVPDIKTEVYDRLIMEEFLAIFNLNYRLRYLDQQLSPFSDIDSTETARLERTYYKELSGERNKIYDELAAKGTTSARWVSEQKAYALVKSAYDDAIYQYRCDWLGNQSLDIFIPSLGIGIEYQGKQHYVPVSAFGGEEGLKERIKLDEKKKKLCESNGIVLLEWRFDEPLTAPFILDKISDVIEAQSKETKADAK